MKPRNLLLTALLLSLPLVTHATTPPTIVAVSLAPRSPDNVLVPQLTIQSDAAISNTVFYINDLSQTNWTILTNLLVTETPYTVLDVAAPPASMRFYRILAEPVPFPHGAVVIPAGAFVMGDPLGVGNPDELPLHTNYLSSFQMDTNLVTQALWDDVYQWALAHEYQFGQEGTAKDTDHPVVEVSWYDAVKWCNARSEKEGLVPAYWTDSDQTNVYRSGQIDLDSASVQWNAGYRLPTEAEWEKGARGGASGHDYPWYDSDDFSSDRANVLDDPVYATGPYPHTSPAGSFPPNSYGLYDMAGNVWEWCWDWYQDTWYADPAASADDSRGPDSADYRVLRGGSWNDDETAARSARRGQDSAFFSFNAYGFRCVKGPERE